MRTLLHPRTVAGSSSTLSEKQYTYMYTQFYSILQKIICTSFYVLFINFHYFHAYFRVINYSMQVKITGTSTSGRVTDIESLTAVRTKVKSLVTW